MLRSAPREREWVSWLTVGLWSLTIFATIPLARAIERQVRTRWGAEVFSHTVIAVVLLAAGAAVAYLVRFGTPARSAYLWLAGTAAIFVGYTIQLGFGSPIEALHFVEYGVLGVLAYRALVHRLRDPGVYLAAAALCAIVGILDELVQWATPRRIWDLRDIWLNFFAGVLAEVALAKGLRPRIISGPLTPASVRWACRLSLTATLLLAASLLNTPPRIAWYADRLPLLAFLKTNQGVMLEYGYLYDEPDTGRFRSRFSPEELRRIDAERGPEAAQILDRFRDPSIYDRFLATYTPVSDPFVHEARVHLFRRDTYLAASEKYRDSEREYRRHLTVVFRENQIMEEYFHHALHRSSYVLPPERIADLRAHLLPDYVYESRVSERLVTGVSEAQVVGVLAAVCVALLAVERRHGRPTLRPHSPLPPGSVARTGA